MRKRRNYRKRIPSGMKIRWGIIIVLIFSFAGVSYSAHTNVLTSFYKFGTSSMSFIFNDESDVVVEMAKGSDGKITDLGGNASYQDKKLVISDIGPIDMKDFEDGNVNIRIQYAIKVEDDENGIRRPAEVKENDKTGYDLGTVDFKRLPDTLVWSLENGGSSWGTRSDEAGGTPAVVNRLIPDVLGKFHVYNQILPHKEDGIIKGTMLLVQEGDFLVPDVEEIDLSSLNLSSAVTDEAQNDSLLEIQGAYGFTIPLELDQFNVEK